MQLHSSRQLISQQPRTFFCTAVFACIYHERVHRSASIREALFLTLIIYVRTGKKHYEPLIPGKVIQYTCKNGYGILTMWDRFLHYILKERKRI